MPRSPKANRTHSQASWGKMGWMSELMHFFAFLIASVVALFSAAAATPDVPPIISAPPPLLHATVLFGGDMMFDRTIRSTIEKNGGDFIFSCIDPILKKADLVVANLEGPITDQLSKSVGTAPGADGNYTFTFPTSTAEMLFAHNIRMVNIGNNHITNFGSDGIRSTIQRLDAAGVSHFGDPLEHSVAKEHVKGIPLAFINYNEFSSGGGSASGGGAATTTIRHIREALAEGKLPVVYTHWGVEYATTPSAYSRELARSFIDAGAEIVVGSHPHVVQEREFYREKYIYYSLGNLIFDQYWNDDVRHGLMVSIDFDPTGVQYVEEIPVELGRDRRTCLVE